MPKKLRGFTLIELMVVVAIIGILASISLPAYQDYTTRAKVATAIELASEIKPGVIHYYKEKYRFPKSNSEAGVPDAQYIIGNHVTAVSVEAGAIHIEMGNKVGGFIQGKVLSLRPISVIGSPESPVSWICGFDTPPKGMQSHGENKTTLEERHLPAACRG